MHTVSTTYRRLAVCCLHSSTTGTGRILNEGFQGINLLRIRLTQRSHQVIDVDKEYLGYSLFIANNGKRTHFQ
jgi:hypothetical protein